MNRLIDATDYLRLSYPVNKTISFNINPVGKTREMISRYGIIENDSLKVEKAKIVKQYIDRFHKNFIEKVLKDAVIDFSELESETDLFNEAKKTGDADFMKKAKNSLSLCRAKYRKIISELFTKNELFSKCKKNELYTELLPEILTEEEMKDVEFFKNYYTYFSDFNLLRTFIYAADEKHNTIAYRIVHENFPVWYSNKKSGEQNGEGFRLDALFPVSSEAIDEYNNLISGVTDGKDYKKGLNQLINESSEKGNLKSYKKLFKNILCEEKKQYSVSTFETSEEIVAAVKLFHVEFEKYYKQIKENLFNINLSLSDIYVSRKKLSKFSYEICGDWKVIRNIKDLEEKDYYSLSELNDYYISNKDDKSPDFYAGNYLTGASIPDINKLYDSIKFEELTDLRQNKEKVGDLKKYLEEVLHLYNYLRLVECDDTEINKNETFYGFLNNVLFALSDIVLLYNKTRNFVTKKFSEVKKIKLNFDCATLLGGWDVNVEKVNNGMFFHDEEEDKYYIGIYNNAKTKPEFKATTEGSFKKMFYKYVGQANKMLPKIVFSKKWIPVFNPSEEIIEGYKAKKHLKGDGFDLDFCHKLIDFFKYCIANYEGYKVYGFKFSETETYNDISDFYREIAEQGYKIDMLSVSKDDVFKAVENEQVYLFELDNIFMRGKRHGYDRYTEYLKDIFKPDSLNKLDGFASIYYRPKLTELKREHKKGSILLDKNTKDGLTVPSEIYFELLDYLNKRNDKLSKETQKWYDSGKLTYFVCKDDYSKNIRFSKEQFSLHLPMKFNYRKADVYPGEFNRKVQEYIKENKDINILAVNRGENNLLYSVLLDRSGNVLESRCYNELLVGNRNIDFKDKLKVRETERKNERQEWQKISKIENIKEGYLSYVVSEIVNTMLEKNACLVMEDLSGDFVAGRQKIETNIYQKFETMLLNKLSYIHLKKKDNDEAGSIRKPLQLVPAFESLEKIGMQFGFVFFVNSAYTSKTDPDTGFINVFNFRELTNFEKKISFLKKFSKVYNEDKTVVMEYDSSVFNKDIKFDYRIRLEGEYNLWNNESRHFETVDVQELAEKAFGLIGCSLEQKHEDLLEKVGQLKFNLINNSFITLFLKAVETVTNAKTRIDDDYIYISPEKRSNVQYKSLDYVASYNMGKKFLFILNQDKFRNIKYSDYVRLLKEEVK